MQARSHFRVINFKHPSGTTVFRVTGCGRDGKQLRKNFRNEDDATLFAQKCEREYRGLAEPELMTVTTRLSEAELEQAESSIAILRESFPGMTLIEAIKWMISNYRPALISKLLHDAVTEFIAAKKQALRSKATIQPMESRCTAFARRHPTKLVSDVRPSDIELYVFTPGIKPYSSYSNRLVLQGFFNWCMERKFCTENPVDPVAKVTLRKGKPQFLSLDLVKNLLLKAETERGGSCLPLVVLSLFAGLRPAEAHRFNWADFNPETKTLTVEPKRSGSASHRIVELEPNAVAWLKKCQNQPVDSGRRAWDAVKAAVGFRGRETEANKDQPEWIADILRHTALTYHYALHDSSITSRWAGNSPEMLHSHYRGLVTKKAAQKYWALVPAEKGKNKIVLMPAAAVA